MVAIAAGYSGGSGGGAPATSLGGNVEFLTSDVVEQVFPTSGVVYWPIADGNYLRWQHTAGKSGDVTFSVAYSMSVDNGGDLEFDVEAGVFADGDDPNGALSAEAGVSVTPGSGTDKKTLSVVVSGVTQGDTVVVLLTRNDPVSGAHTGEANVFGVRG